MHMYCHEDIKKIAEEEDVKFIRLQFTDILGKLKNVAITVSQLDKILEDGMMFDGSSIIGFTRIENSDMYLKPDLDTFTILPWENSTGKVARIICDVYKLDQTPFEGCPRNILKKTLQLAKDKGYEFNVGNELEFFLFKIDEHGDPIAKTNDMLGYFDVAPDGSDVRKEICLTLEKMGFEIEASHHECGTGQHEINFKYDNALKTADNVATFRMVVKCIAQKHGLYASFMPKPITGVAGSGMHTNMSLFKNGKNAFYDENDALGLSLLARNFIAGILGHIKGITAFTNPLINSYKRLVPGYEAPCYTTWSASNRTGVIRIPASRGIATRIELRSPDPSSNPYFCLALCLAAGIEGITKEIKCPNSIDENVFSMSENEKNLRKIENLPSNLQEALQLMDQDGLAKQVLGEHTYSIYKNYKKREWDNYKTHVSNWELDKYMKNY